MTKFILTLFFFIVTTLLLAQTPKGNLSGKVIDEQTHAPLFGVNIYIKDSNQGTTTNENGEYNFYNLKSGTYQITFSYIGYEKSIKTDVIIKSGRTEYLDVFLIQSVLEIEGVTVSSGYFTEVESKPLSTTNFSNEEIRRAPGSAGDISRIISGLPSLAKVNDQKNSLIVRGGSPVENSFYLDNIEIPNINHFPVAGSSDGPIGLINVDFLKNVNFYSGGFSSMYGDKLSSVMELEYREGNSESFNSQLNLSFMGFGGTVEGPIGNSASYMVAINKSYLDLIVGSTNDGETVIPQFGDVQGKVVYNIDNKNKLTLLSIHSIDDINYDYEKAVKTNSNGYGTTNGVFNTTGVNWKHIWKNGYSNLSASNTYSNFDRTSYETKSISQTGANNSIENSTNIRSVNFLKLNKKHGIEFGVEAKIIQNNFDFFYKESMDNYGNTSPAITIKKTLNTFKSGAFFNYNWQLTDVIRLNAGGRADYFDFNQKVKFSPRGSISFSLGDKTTLTAGAGIFYQNIPTLLLAQSNSFKDLKTPQSNHYIISLARDLGNATRLSIEAYYKNYSNFAIDPTQPEVFIFDEAVSQGVFLSHADLIDNGKAFSKGVEVTLQKKLAEDFYGLVAGSISKAKYKDLNGKWRDRIYDNQFNFTLEGGYVPNDTWEFKVRWIYAGGAPYTPYDEVRSKELKKGIWNLSKFNEERMSDYHSLNIRVDKRFYFSNSNLIVFLSVWNAYGRKNIAQIYWDETNNKKNVEYQWNTLPVFGVEYEF